MEYNVRLSYKYLIPIVVIWVALTFYVGRDNPWFQHIRIGGVALLAVGLVAGFVYRKYKHSKIRKTGEPAKAEITDVKETGIYDRAYNPQVKLTLEVMPPDKPAYTAHYKGFFSGLELHKLQVGNVIHVKYNPEKPQDVVLAVD